jgi:hypothetical protein
MQAVCSVGVVYSRHFVHRHGYEGLRAQTKEIFERNSLIHCPYFGTDVVLNAEGLHHLRYSAERERTKPEQMLKFRLLPLALDVIRKSGTVQEYRKIWQAIGKKGADGKRVEGGGVLGPRRHRRTAAGQDTRDLAAGRQRQHHILERDARRGDFA